MSNYRQSSWYPRYKGTKIAFAAARKDFGLRLGAACSALSDFRRNFRELSRTSNPRFELSLRHLTPCLRDKTTNTPVEPIYFYQDAWAAGKIIAARPARHVDVGSHVPTIGIIAEVLPTAFVDIRPIPVNLPGLEMVEGSILALPFADQSLLSLSSICVIEHIGLGRYGDPIDAFGSEKAAAELQRVLAPGGQLYISVPVDAVNRIYFNGHRAFTPNTVRELFGELEVVEERYIYGYERVDHYQPERGFGTGLFHFRRGA